jgi:3-methylfumaryl-CoA hydratase
MSLNEWIGKSEDRSDSMAPEQLQRFEAMMNRDPSAITEGSELPACSHWAYFTPLFQGSQLGVNGNPIKDPLLPPVELPRRMWAGGNIQFKKPLKAGTPADKKSTIVKIEEKNGNTGKLCFVTLRHQISSRGAIAIDEEQVYVFREESEKGAHPIRTEPLDLDTDWKKITKPDSVQLFRFSALSFNSHRIHYDRDYAQNVEGYPDLVVHAPLLLLIMLDAFKTKHDGKVIENLHYESSGPVYLGEQITIHGKSTDNFKADLRICGPEGKVAMKATINWTYSWK